MRLHPLYPLPRFACLHSCHRAPDRQSYTQGVVQWPVLVLLRRLTASVQLWRMLHSFLPLSACIDS